MEARDERLEPVSSFALRSFRLEPQTWREFVSEEEQQLLFASFFTCPDSLHLFICRDAESQLSVSLTFPTNISSKVICVSKTGREAVTKETAKKAFIIQEVQGDDALSFMSAITEQVICPLLSNPENSHGWVAGVAEEALRFMERQKNEAQVMKAQVDGRTFLPQPDALHDDRRHDNSIQGERKLLDVRLVHACESTVIEWAELVSEFLQQDSSQPLLDGLKPPPTEEFHFWKNRLKNLQFIQQQLMSSRAQQVASILQTADSVYCCTLTDIYRHVQEGLEEAEDVTQNLRRLQEKLEDVEQLEYQQLRDNMAAVMEEVRLVWIRSQFYCKPCRIVVLLQEICNLFVQLSREFLRGKEVMRGLAVDPGPVLDDVRLVILTLQTLKEAYSLCRTQLDQDQGGLSHRWDFPSHLVFFHLDNFLKRLQGIEEVHCVSLQLYQLDQTALSGVSGRMWSDVVQDVYQDFLCHVAVLSDCGCDATDPDDQSFQLHLDQFQVQVWDLERRLVSVLSRALQDCCASSSAAKLLQMFRFILDRPLIQEQLRPHLSQLLEVVLTELDQTWLLVCSQREKADTFCRFTPRPAAVLCWTQQLQLRAQEALKNYKAVQHLCVDSGEVQVVLQRFQQVVDLLQDFRDTVMSNWSFQLDSDSGFILEQPLIQHNQQGILGVTFSQKLEALQRELRYVSRETDVDLHPYAARLFTCRDDVTQIYLSLSHMVSSYNQVVSGVLQVELPLIQDQLQDLDQSLLALQRNTWSSEGVQQLVEQQRQKVSMFCTTVNEARANMDTMTHIIQGWAELHLLQRSGDSLLEGRATEQSYRRLREEGQELLRLTQENQSLYKAQDSSHAWSRYLDHIDDKVQDGLFQLLLRSLHFLSDNMNPQTCSAALLAVSLQLQDAGTVFEPSVGSGLSDLMKTIISDVYTAASLLPRISVSRHGNYQVSLQQSPDLSALEQEVMHRLLEVREEAERLRSELDRYSYLWQSDRRDVMQEFLTYSRQLGPEELEPEEAPPTLKDFKREIDSLHRLYTEVTHLDDVIVLHGWLQVNLQPFRDSLLSVIQDWSHMYTQHLLDSVSDSLQQVTQRGDDDDEEPSSCSFSPTETILLLEAAGVELPEHLSAQLQC
ncbi:dynein axonemal heavy chain 17-like isoform X1 [Thunnus albacares]|uniref:dynein axonemal heavy chain 17-like isoform X1 n=2 Tax=Thunnus albacares TaxID=8236 RepID=UPI001CF6B761|nr:dynein axonemal heavy chain 17-like isoform X1 [Thunnus albacares]